ncbi:transcriptional regulator, XRE family [Desulfofarcimen acetoxidans DSM 771]|uniref:Transcriptional regulator, XRE family n=1 Tax=Desulfofarcimen acetoxidans (strain ATCC 49208 / DSM 771 / KCTC 5769 / VKM B-1644 / 5575) TaxID=485916 RepID=C8VWR7_DESAS|nr:helix-turn-helix domain-containing protein [Desulfofarcimen acetoxidans]ACV64431.1 transcriptional regulator, XRE family [Desulfofarcimen acetoxidans DSM 771]
MNFNDLGLSNDVRDSLEIIYQKANKICPALTREVFLNGVLKEWLNPYLRQDNKPVLQKDKVILRNNLKQALTLSGKTQSKIAQEIGVNRSYIGQIFRGCYDPSVKLALILLQSLNYPPEKFTDLFFLEPVE